VPLGWAAIVLLAHQQLLAGTPVVLPLSAVAAGAVAVAGAGLAAVAIGIRISTRPIADQWRRAVQRPATRAGWTDAAVLAAAVGGLLWLAGSGGLQATSSTSAASPTSLVAPALLALAVAMIGSRLLPWACRRLYRRTARSGMAGFLAVRQVTRRPTTLGVTLLLTVALAIAAFAVSAFTVAGGNRRDV
jgi:hypothetical protein